MKLDWLRAGCVSIAESCGYTATTWKIDVSEWRWELRCNESGRHSAGARIGTREAAEAACEAWLDQHDKPVWHDATEWLSWAEWRGECLIIRKVSDNDWKFNRVGATYNDGTHPTCVAAKMSAEQYVREQTGGAA